jgi:hypothetical protein
MWHLKQNKVTKFVHNPEKRNKKCLLDCHSVKLNFNIEGKVNTDFEKRQSKMSF